MNRTKGINLNEAHLNFLISFCGGNPFYLDILSFRIKDLAEKKNLNSIPKRLLLNSIKLELFSSSGALYNYFTCFIEENLEKKGFLTFIKILSAIAEGFNSISKISKSSSIPQTSLPRLLNKLIKLDLIRKENKNYFFIDVLMEFWFLYVYNLKEESFIPKLNLKLEEFKSKVSEMIDSFKRELGRARESQIREIFTKLGYSVKYGILNKEEFDLIAKKNDKVILGEVKAKNVNKKEINRFIEKLNKAKYTKAILFCLSGINKNTAKSCEKEKIEIWDLNKINKERKKINLSRINL